MYNILYNIFIIITFIVALPVFFAATYFIVEGPKYLFIKFDSNFKISNGHDKWSFYYLVFYFIVTWVFCIIGQVEYGINYLNIIGCILFILGNLLINYICVLNKSLFINNQNLQWYILMAYLINWYFCLLLLNSHVINLIYISFSALFIFLCLLLLYTLNTINKYNKNLFYYIITTISIINAYVNYSNLYIFYFIVYAGITAVSLSYATNTEVVKPIIPITSNNIFFVKLAKLFIYDLKVIKYHFLTEFKMYSALRQILVFILFANIILKQQNVINLDFIIVGDLKNVAWNSYFILLALFLWVLYIRNFIILYCNPIAELSTLARCMGACAAIGGGSFMVRDSILNSNNPVNIPIVTEKLQTSHWGYICLNEQDHRYKNNWYELHKTKPMPTFKHNTWYGTFDRPCLFSIKSELDKADK